MSSDKDPSNSVLIFPAIRHLPRGRNLKSKELSKNENKNNENKKASKKIGEGGGE
jgi:hypothetical protein